MLSLNWVLRTSVLSLLITIGANAHPGSGIAVDRHGQIFFVDTGQGVWKIDKQGQLTLFHRLAYHWMALDEKGHFAHSQALGDFDRGSFERISQTGSIPTLILSSDYPITVGHDGALYYVPYNSEGLHQIIRRMPDGQRSIFATLPTSPGDKPMLWVNGIAAGADGNRG